MDFDDPSIPLEELCRPISATVMSKRSLHTSHGNPVSEEKARHLQNAQVTKHKPGKKQRFVYVSPRKA